MAYVSDVVSASSPPALEAECPLPPHTAGDVVFVCFGQDQATSGTFTEPGSPWVSLSQQASGGVRHWVGYAVAPQGGLSAPVMSSTVSDEWALIGVTIKDADASNVVDAFNVSLSTANSPSSPSVTTSTDNCLMLAFLVEDLLPKYTFDFTQITPLAYVEESANQITAFCGYTVAYTAGAAPSVNGVSKVITDTTHFIYVAVRNSVGGELPPVLKTNPAKVLELGGRTALTINLLPSSLTTFNGLPVSGSGTLSTATPSMPQVVSRYGGFAVAPPTADPSGWYGWVTPIPQADFSSGVFSLQLGAPYSLQYVGSQGFALVLVDALENWAVYHLCKTGDLPQTTLKVFVLDFGSLLPDAVSTTPPNFAAITKVGFIHHRLTGSPLSRGTYATNFLKWPEIVVAGGNSTSYSHVQAIAAPGVAGAIHAVTGFTNSQFLLRVPVCFGDGVTDTAIRFQNPVSFYVPGAGLNDKTNNNSVQIGVDLSANSTLDLTACSFIAETSAKLKIKQTSAPTATYEFNKATFSRFNVEWSAGVECKGAIFNECVTIDTDGAPFAECSFVESGTVTSNPSNISNCSFTQGAAGGHAIEITQPGTFSFVGNTFDGYGLDGTTDAAIYNNSGGHVVLNVSGGGDTPTVRNGAGATTDVVSGVTLTFSGIKAGSEIHIFDENSVLLASVESAISNQTISLQVTGMQVRIFIASLGYENIDIPYAVPGSDAVIPVSQRIDRNYRNPI